MEKVVLMDCSSVPANNLINKLLN